MICTFYTKNDTSKRPAVAVGIGRSVYIYRNLRPYFKLSLPEVLPYRLLPAEEDLWSKASTGLLESTEFFAMLDKLCSEERLQRFTAQLQQAIHAYTTHGQSQIILDEFVEVATSSSPKLPTVVTCMAVLLRDENATPSAGFLVIGSENGLITMVEPNGFRVIFEEWLPSSPMKIVAWGFERGHNRLFVACRNNTIVTMRHNVKGRSLPFSVGIVDIVLCNATRRLAVGLMNSTLRVISFQGKVTWQSDVQGNIILLQVRREGTVQHLLAVILRKP